MATKPPYFTDWAPLPSLPIATETLPNGKTQTTYRNQFHADGDITVFQLMKSVHWVGYASAVLGNATAMLGGGFPVGGLQTPSIDGYFEYIIIDPSGKTIFWSRVYICIMLVMAVESSIGGIGFSSGTVIWNPDDSVRYGSYSYPPPSISTVMETPSPPVLRQQQDNNGNYTKSIVITTGDLVNLKAGNGTASSYTVERAVGVELNNATWTVDKDSDFSEIGTMVLTGDTTSGAALEAPIITGTSQILVSNSSNFPTTAGFLKIGDEIISYTSRTDDIFKGIQRAQKGSVASDHATGTAVGDMSKIIYQYIDTTGIQAGQAYFYRIKAISGSDTVSGQANSILVYSPSQCVTIIDTYIIDGIKTSINPTLTPYDTFVTYDQLQQNYISKLSPGQKEETFSFTQERPDSGRNTDWTIPGGDSIIVDGWWLGPIYQFNIPDNSILHIIHDGLSFGTFTSQGRGAEWYFRFHSENVLWGVIKNVAGRMFSTQQRNGGVTLIDAHNVDSQDTINTSRAKITFSGGSSAFLYDANDGAIYVIVTKNGIMSVYVSLNGGNNFSPFMNGSQQVTLFGGSASYTAQDITKDDRGVAWVVALSGGRLFVTSSKSVFQDSIYVGEAVSGEGYFFKEHETSPLTTKEMTIIGTTHSFRSSNYGKTWFEIPYTEDNDIADEEQQYKIIDSYHDGFSSLRLRQNGDRLFIQNGDTSLDSMSYVGQVQPYPDNSGLSGSNTYKLIDSSDYNSTGQLTVQGQTNAFITNNKGKNWQSVDIAQENY